MRSSVKRSAIWSGEGLELDDGQVRIDARPGAAGERFDIAHRAIGLQHDGAGVEACVLLDGVLVAGLTLHHRKEEHLVVLPAHTGVGSVFYYADDLEISRGVGAGFAEAMADGIRAHGRTS